MRSETGGIYLRELPGYRRSQYRGNASEDTRRRVLLIERVLATWQMVLDQRSSKSGKLLYVRNTRIQPVPPVSSTGCGARAKAPEFTEASWP